MSYERSPLPCARTSGLRRQLEGRMEQKTHSLLDDDGDQTVTSGLRPLRGDERKPWGRIV